MPGVSIPSQPYSPLGTLGGVAGGAIGTYFGGSTGGVAGSKFGSMLGNAGNGSGPGAVQGSENADDAIARRMKAQIYNPQYQGGS